MKIYILYHGQCPDGFGSAWSAYKFLGINPEIEYIPITHGSKLPEIEDGSYIYMLDFASKADVLKKLGEKNRVVVLDHHKTAKADLAEFPKLLSEHTVKNEKYEEMPYGVFVRFNMDKSGAMLSWEFFNPDLLAPNLIKYIQDRDLWRFNLDRSRAFNAHLRCHPFEFEAWDKVQDITETIFTNRNLEAFIDTGKICLIQDARNIEMICRQAKLINFNGHKVVVVCATSHWSDVGNDLVEKYPEADYVMSYYHSPKKSFMKMSLRCKDGFDVSEVASKFDGGGHQKASGYVLQGPAITKFLETIDKEESIEV